MTAREAPRWLKHPMAVDRRADPGRSRRCTTPRGFPWLVTWNTLAGADWGLLAAAGAINLLSLAAKAWAWQLLVRPFGPLTFRTAQAATFAGAAINAIGVAMSGEAGRIHLASSRDGVAVGLVTRSVVASRIVEAAALGIFLLGVVAGVTSEHGWRLLGGGVLLIGGALALLRWIPWLRPGRGEGAAPGWTTPARGAARAQRGLVGPPVGHLPLVDRGHGRERDPPPSRSSRWSCRTSAASSGSRRATWAWCRARWCSGSGRRGSRPRAPWPRGSRSRPSRCLPVLLVGVGLLGRHGMRELARRRAVEPA